MPDKIAGLEQLQARLAELAKKYPDQAGKALYQEALKVEKLSRSLTPILTGALKGSHETTFPERASDGTISVRILVGGPAAPYAIFVHENLDAYHKVGQAKFLEYALLSSQRDLLQGIIDRLSKVS